MPAGGRCVIWDKRKSGRGIKGEDLRDLLEMEAERKRGSQQVIYYRAGDETGRLNLEKRRER